MRIIVNPRPQITASSTPVCGRDSATLTVSGLADSYNWSPTTAMSLPASRAVVKVAPTVNTTYTVTARFNATGCQSSATSTVTVRSKPAITATFVNPTTCGGTNGSITLHGLAKNGTTSYTLRYSKNGVAVAPVSRTSSTAGTIVIGSLTAGSYTNINVELNGCKSNTLGPIPLSNPNPPVLTIPGDSTVCAGTPTGTITFSATPTSTFNWTNNNASIGLTASGTSSSIPSFTPTNGSATAQTATISVTARANGCTSAPKTMRIIVNPRPQITASSTPVCGRDSATLTVSGLADSYNWSPTTAMSLPASRAVVKVAPTVNTTYTVTARFNATGCQSSATSTVTVRSKPAKPSITISGGNLVSSSASGNQWQIDGTNISGATGQLYTPQISGFYSVEVTSNGCSSKSEPYNFSKSFMVQSNSTLSDESIQIYPNPISGNFIVEYNLIDEPKELNINVMNNAGTLVKQYRNIKSLEQLNGNELPVGQLIFIFETLDAQRKWYYKIIKY
jgi:hypothetical protein